MKRRRGGKAGRKLLGSHQRSWIWGRNLVRETLEVGTWPILELHLADHLLDAEMTAARQSAAQRDIPVQIDSSDRLIELCHSRENQGYVAKMGPFPYADADIVLQDHPQIPLYLILDSLQDPYNFGAIIRCAEVFAVDAIFIGSERQTDVTSLVARSSAGAVNRVPIAKVPKLTALATKLRTDGIMLVAADETAELRLEQFDFSQSLAVVIGNEGSGVTPELAACCTSRVRIPMLGKIGSLNAAVAAGIVLYEARRQSKID